MESIANLCKKALSEPLLHFLLIGVCLFGLYAWLNPDSLNSERRIVVNAGTVDSIKQRFFRMWQRNPTTQELQGLIEDHVLEEIYYREALALGIDKNDPVIRRRLRQKMEIYTDNLAATLAPTEQELQRYLQHHPDKFKTEPRYSFQQIYLNSDAPPEQLTHRIESIQRGVRAGETIAGDGSLLPAQVNNAEASAIDRIFGGGFAAKLDTLELNQWSEVLRSGVGLHWVKLSDRQAGTLPALTMIKEKVEREWRFDRAQELDQALRKKLLAGYDIVIAETAKANSL